MPEAGAADEADDRFGVWRENVESLRAFIRLRTRWVWVANGMGSAMRTGLDYAGVIMALPLMGVKRNRLDAVFNDLQEMEWAALEEWGRARR